jgi:hypothetical protein
MKISKKLYTTLIIAVLTLSTVIAAIPMASAEITSDPFLVNPYTGVDVTSAAVGQSVKVVANATRGRADAFAVVTVYWDSLAGTVLGTTTADNNGDYSITVKIPASVAGNHWIITNDGETESGGAIIAVTPSLSVLDNYGMAIGLPGDTLNVVGHGYAPNDVITLFCNLTTSMTTSYEFPTPVFTTNGTGSFSGSITIPAIPMSNFGTYEFNGTDEASNSAVTNVSIDYYIVTYPSSGPTGIDVMIMGRIAPSEAYTIRFNGAAIGTGTTDSTGFYSMTYTIPAVLSPAGYTVDIWWDTTENRDTLFTVTATPTIVLGASSGIAGQVVTITGADFVPNADITLYFGSTAVNSTGADDRFGPTNDGYFTFPAGAFAEEFVVPILTPGTYSVSVVDSWGATSASGVFFTIVPTPLMTIETRSSSYYQGDLMSLYTWTNTIPTYYIDWTIVDSTGNLFIAGTVDPGDWDMISTNNYQVPYIAFRVSTYFCNMIPDDAPIGVWNFTAINAATTQTIATNLFSVSAKPTMQTVLDAIDDCCTNLTALLMDIDASISEIDGAVATVSTTVGDIELALEDIDAAISGIDGDVVSIKTTVGTFQTSLSSIDGVVSAVNGLDEIVGVIVGDTTEIKTTLGTLEGTITDISDGVATIQTDLGTTKVDVASIKTDLASVQSNVDESLPVSVDMMPVWIAVVLSLIAAIAAIFAVVTIRQKIAG